MRIKYAVLLAALLVAVRLAAQSAEAGEPDLVLPSMVLEVEDAVADPIVPILPGVTEEETPELSAILPELPGLEVSDEMFLFSLDPTSVGDGTGAVTTSTGSPVGGFLGEINVAAGDRVLGDVRILSFDSELPFSLAIFHEKVDGFGLRSPGAGYFAVDDVISGSVRVPSWGLSAQGTFQETEWGLQGLSPFGSIDRRIFAVDVSGDWSSGLLASSVAGHYAQYDRILTGADPERLARSLASLDAGVRSSWRTIEYGLDGELGYLSRENELMYADFEASAQVWVRSLAGDLVSWSFRGGVWSDLQNIAYPFSLEIDRAWPNGLRLDVSGGYRVVPIDLAEAVRLEPFTTLGDALSERSWYGAALISWALDSGFRAESESQFDWYEESTVPGDTTDGSTGLYNPVDRLGAVARQSTRVSVPLPLSLSMRVGWDWMILGASPRDDSHRVSASFGRDDLEETFGGRLDLEWGFDENFPLLSLEGSFRPADGLGFQLSIQDILAPIFRSGGAHSYGAYEGDGFGVTLGARLTF